MAQAIQHFTKRALGDFSRGVLGAHDPAIEVLIRCGKQFLKQAQLLLSHIGQISVRKAAYNQVRFLEAPVMGTEKQLFLAGFKVHGGFSPSGWVMMGADPIT